MVLFYNIIQEKANISTNICQEFRLHRETLIFTPRRAIMVGEVIRMLIDMLEKYTPDCEQEIQDKRMMLHYARQFDDILLRSNETAHFTASPWIVNPDRSRVLMVYHNIYGSWSWVGGHADGDQSLLSVALRETQEETGVCNSRPLSEDIFSLEILTVPAHFKRGKYVVPHLHLNATFLVEADDRQPIRIKPDENSAVRWFDLDEAVEVCSEPAMKVIYQKLNDKLRRL